jgi:hypothetical protein
MGSAEEVARSSNENSKGSDSEGLTERLAGSFAFDGVFASSRAPAVIQPLDEG